MFNIKPNDKFIVLIDGPNFYATQQLLNFKIDFKRMWEYFNSLGRLVRINYYTGVMPKDSEQHDPIRKMLDYIQYNKYCVISKEMKIYQGQDGKERRKANMDVEITLDLMKYGPNVDHVIFMTGDGDFCPVIDHVQGMGTVVHVVSTIKGDRNICSDDLRRTVDNFVDLGDLSIAMTTELTLRTFPENASEI